MTSSKDNCHFLQGVEFWAVNTDAQALENSCAMNKLQLGIELTRGLGEGFLMYLQKKFAGSSICSTHRQAESHASGSAGTGGKGELGEQAAQESHDQLGQAVSNADMVGFSLKLLPAMLSCRHALTACLAIKMSLSWTARRLQ